MTTYRVGAKTGLPIAKTNDWDGGLAKQHVFAWAGFDGDNPDPVKAADAFLAYDADNGTLRGSYKLPFADVIDGTLTAMPGGLRAAASRLPQADIPSDVQTRARKVLDGYFARLADMNDGKGAGATVEHKTIPLAGFEVKATEDGSGGWEVAGYASTFGGSPDSYGDVVARGAFTDSLAKRETKLLWQHDMGEPIGKQLSLIEDDKGLFGRWSIIPTDAGTKAHQLVAAGLVDALSIGFLTREADYNDDGVRVLKAVDLYEVSLVTVPANEAAVVTSYKHPIPFDQVIARAQTALDRALDEAEALSARRRADGRALNERHRAGLEELGEAAKAALARLAALAGDDPPAEAKADITGLSLRLELARRKHAGVLREQAS